MRGLEVRCLARTPEKVELLERQGFEARLGDVTDAGSLEGAGRDVAVAYYLVHAMAGGGDFAERERRGARSFARMAKREGVERVVYLGGLGDEAVSKHLASRHETARVLAAEGPPLTYFRAAMVVGAGSESYRTLRYLVGRLPVMLAPAWLQTDTQPIGIDAAVEYLRRAPEVPESAGREIQIGGPDVLTYAEMLDRMAIAMGKSPRPKLPLPLVTPWLSSLWLGLVTPVDTAVARPLVEGLTTRDGGHRPLRRRALRDRARVVRRDPAAGAGRGRGCPVQEFAGTGRGVAKAAMAPSSIVVIIVGIALALLVNYLLGIIVILIGLAMLLLPMLGARRV